MSLSSSRSATKRSSGGGRNTSDSVGRRLGAKRGDGEFVKAGTILMRQRGTVWHNGENAGLGKDHTIFALLDGYVRFYRSDTDRRYIGIVLNKETRLPRPWYQPRERKIFGKVIKSSWILENEEMKSLKKLAEKREKIKVEFESKSN